MVKKNPVIALAAIKYFDIAKNDNFDKVIHYISLAKKKKADIVCFPESCLHRTKKMHFHYGFVKEIREECKKNSIGCIITDDFVFGKKSHNTAILIDREGKIKGKYKKIHLYGDDGIHPGRKIGVFDTDFGKIGITICWDLAFPKMFKKMKLAGAQIVFCPAQWCFEEKAHDKQHKEREIELMRSLGSTRAFENLFYVAICNPLRDVHDQVSYSAIMSPHKVLKELVDKEGLIVSEIDLKEIGKLEKVYGKFRG